MPNKPGHPKKVSDAAIRRVMHLPTVLAMAKVGLSRAQFLNRRRRIEAELGLPHRPVGRPRKS